MITDLTPNEPAGNCGNEITTKLQHAGLIPKHDPSCFKQVQSSIELLVSERDLTAESIQKMLELHNLADPLEFTENQPTYDAIIGGNSDIPQVPDRHFSVDHIAASETEKKTSE
jgi:hypothetical protein